MNWRRRLAALFVVLALPGCAQGTTGQAGAPSAPYSSENSGNRPSTAVGMAAAAVCSWQGTGERRSAPEPIRPSGR
jgi:hypothetical protein